MNTNSILSSVNTINQTSNSFLKTSTIDKTKSDDFESLISSTKTSTTTTTQPIKEKEPIIYKSSTQSLYEDIISLLKTGFTVGELKAFEEKLKEILKMKKDGKSDNEIESALKKLSLEIQEAKKRVTGEVVKEADNNTTKTQSIATFDTMVTDIKNMLQEIKNSSKKYKDEESDKSYDKLKMLLKMS